jgi:hypothetical protein
MKTNYPVDMAMSAHPAVRFLRLGLVVFAVTGCSNGRDESWYDDASSTTKKRDAYIREQVDAGLDAREARDVYELDANIRRAWTRDPVVIEGGDLKEKFSEP